MFTAILNSAHYPKTNGLTELTSVIWLFACHVSFTCDETWCDRDCDRAKREKPQKRAEQHQISTVMGTVETYASKIPNNQLHFSMVSSTSPCSYQHERFAFFLHLSRNDTYLEVKRRKQKRRQMDDFIVQYKRSKKIKTRLWKQELLANTSKLIHFSMDKQSVAITARWLPTKRLVVNVTFYDSWRLHFQRKSTHAHKQW